ncbi:MAG: nitrilase-related carbon-nitrogen hydrolase [Candidatus Heimdallarchaeaceae archaeon]
MLNKLKVIKISNETKTSKLRKFLRKNGLDIIWLLIGATFYVFIGWKWHMLIAAWITPIFLMRFFRNQEKWHHTLWAYPLLFLATFLNKYNAWDITVAEQIGLWAVLPIITIIPLLIDRIAWKNFKTPLVSLVYPLTILVIDYSIGFSPLGPLLSMAVTQFDFSVFAQLSSLTGIWGMAFLMAWSASIINLIWENNFNFRKMPKMVHIFSGIFIATMIFGSFRIALFEPTAKTVRIGSLTVEHERNYWGEIVDNLTPASEAHLYTDELMELEDRLFNLSVEAAEGGTKIIFWSEGNGVYFEDHEEDFLNRSIAFAQTYEVYFAPAVLELHYGLQLCSNKVMMITPDGEIAFQYNKTYDWLPTDSDGIIPYIDTPYGRIGTVICLDMDFPLFINQAGRNDVDIMIVPAFDSAGLKEFHGRTGLFRGIENGFAIVRQVNEGASFAIDHMGNVLSYQDFFDTEKRLMFSDVPIQGVTTFYSILGDWFAYVSLTAFVGFIVVGIYNKKTGKNIFKRKTKTQ